MDLGGAPKDGIEFVPPSSEMPSQEKPKIPMDDNDKFVRERNLVLLSALHYMYGDEWKEPPDWSKVAETIQNIKAPIYCRGFSAAYCEARYKSLMSNGYEVGVGTIRTILHAPRFFTEEQKRQWIIVLTADDIANLSQLVERQVDIIRKREKANVDAINEGKLKVDPEAMIKVFGNKRGKVDPERLKEDEETRRKRQLALFKDMHGENDYHKFLQYCVRAVNDGVEFYPGLVVLKKMTARRNANRCSYTLPDPPKPMEDMLARLATDKLETITVPTTNVDKTDDKIGPKLSTTECVATSTVTSDAAPTVTKQCETPIKKTTSRSSTRRTSGDKHTAVAVETKKDECPVPMPKIEETQKDDSSKAELNPPSTSEVTAPTKDSQSGVRSAEDPKLEVQTKDIETAPSQNSNHIIEETAKPDTECTKPQPEEVDKPKTVVEINSSSTSDKTLVPSEKAETESPTDNKPEDTAAISEPLEPVPSSKEDAPEPSVYDLPLNDPEFSGKGKEKIPRKGPTTRTSSRLASPEPNEPANDDEKVNRKTPIRQLSNSDSSHTPVLRGRRGATPTKAASVEKEVKEIKTVSSTPPDSKADTEVAKAEESEETFETPRTTPDPFDLKTSLDTMEDNKPKPNLKVYTVKPPSPLSRVDPELFDEIVDEEDDPELAMIDNNISKAMAQPHSPAKTYSRRTRTASSDNATEINPDDVVVPKKSTKKSVAPEDGEDMETATHDGENSKAKRLTRSSLRLHDSQNDEPTDTAQTTTSEKAPSESSTGGKEKQQQKHSKTLNRAKKLTDEKTRLFGETEMEETPDGKRLTRARAKTTPIATKTKNEPPIADSEGVSESEPTPVRATRSRASTSVSHSTDHANSQQTAPMDDEELKRFKTISLHKMEQLLVHESYAALLKYIGDDASKTLKFPLDVQTIKENIESGKLQTPAALEKDLYLVAVNVVMTNPHNSSVNDVVQSYIKAFSTLKEPRMDKDTKGKDTKDESNVSEAYHNDATAHDKQNPASASRRKRRRSASETSEEMIVIPHEKRRVTRTSVSSSQQHNNRRVKNAISPDIITLNRIRH